MSSSIDIIYVVMAVLGSLLLIAMLSNFLSRRLEKRMITKASTISKPRSRTEKLSFADWTNIYLTRAFDIIISAFVVISILAWLTPLIGLFIYINSKGPIFTLYRKRNLFHQTVSLMNYRTFILPKSGEPLRVGRLGAFLRATDLNNMPNFYNILSGRISLIGTTILPATLVSEENSCNDTFQLKGIKPGIISLYQVYHPHATFGGLKVKELNFKDIVGYDLFYIANKSVWLDFKILYRFFVFRLGYATTEKINLKMDIDNTFTEDHKILHEVD